MYRLDVEKNVCKQDVLTVTDIQKTPDLFTSAFQTYFLSGEIKNTSGDTWFSHYLEDHPS